MKKRTVDKQARSGFTLIEILIAVAVIGILATFVIMNIVGVRQKARDSQRKADILHLQSALEEYRADHGSYPISEPGSTQINNTPCGQPLQLNNITYLKKIPCDPLGQAANFNNGDYYYYSADGDSYTVGACLDRKVDPDGQASPP